MLQKPLSLRERGWGEGIKHTQIFVDIRSLHLGMALQVSPSIMVPSAGSRPLCFAQVCRQDTIICRYGSNTPISIRSRQARHVCEPSGCDIVRIDGLQAATPPCGLSMPSKSISRIVAAHLTAQRRVVSGRVAAYPYFIDPYKRPLE